MYHTILDHRKTNIKEEIAVKIAWLVPHWMATTNTRLVMNNNEDFILTTCVELATFALELCAKSGLLYLSVQHYQLNNCNTHYTRMKFDIF